jgi:hypothetical protein
VEFKEKAKWSEWPHGRRVLLSNRFGLDANGLTVLAAPLEKVEHLRQEAQRQRQEKTQQRGQLVRDRAMRTNTNPHKQAKRVRKTTNTNVHVTPDSQGGVQLVTPSRSRESSPLGREPRSEEPRRPGMNRAINLIEKYCRENCQEFRQSFAGVNQRIDLLQQENGELKRLIVDGLLARQNDGGLDVHRQFILLFPSLQFNRCHSFPPFLLLPQSRRIKVRG